MTMTTPSPSVPQAALPQPAPTPQPKPPSEIARNARAFEAVFLGQMTQLLLGSVEQQGEVSGGPGADAFRGILAEQIGTAIAARGGIGLSSAVMTQMLTLQGGIGNAR